MKDHYLTYNAVQLAADEDFIRWVRLGAAADETAWQAWLERHPEQRPVVDEAKGLVRGLTFHPRQPEVDKEQLWNRIRTNKDQPASIQPLKRRPALWRIAGAAAAAVLLIGVLWLAINLPNRLETDLAEHLEQVLPDQSTVQLNAGSRLTYDDSGRRIDLSGEAFFAVQKGADFIVETDLGKVQVLGTRFNVFSRDNRFEVQCTEGRVRVTASADEEGVILTAGMACKLNAAGQLETYQMEGAAAEVGWLQGMYRYNDQPLDEVFAEIQRQFDIQINAGEQIKSIKHTGFFEAGELEEALRNVCWPQNLEFTIEAKQVRITEKATE